MFHIFAVRGDVLLLERYVLCAVGQGHTGGSERPQVRGDQLLPVGALLPARSSTLLSNSVHVVEIGRFTFRWVLKP